MPQPAAIAVASPVAQAPKPATDAEGLAPALTPVTIEVSASAAKPKPADTDAAAASSKHKGVNADTSDGDRKIRMEKRGLGMTRGRRWRMVVEGKEREQGCDQEGRRDNKGAWFIFMCNKQTKQECFKNRLFGLPNGKLGMVKKIKPGAKLFLYDFDLKLLYDVYKAASNGGLNIVPEAFHGKFAAQVILVFH
jgi:hypothetical protein